MEAITGAIISWFPSQEPGSTMPAPQNVCVHKERNAPRTKATRPIYRFLTHARVSQMVADVPCLQGIIPE